MSKFVYGPTGPVGVAAIERQLVDDALAELLDAAGIPDEAPVRTIAERDHHAVVGPQGIYRGPGMYPLNDVRAMFGLPPDTPIVHHAAYRPGLARELFEPRRSKAPASDQEAQP